MINKFMLLIIITLLCCSIAYGVDTITTNDASLGSCGAVNYGQGMEFEMNEEAELKKVSLFHGATGATTVSLNHVGNNSFIAEATITNFNATFDAGIILNNAQSYKVFPYNGGSNYQSCQDATYSAYPYNRVIFDWTNGANDNGTSQAGKAFNVIAIVTGEVAPPVSVTGDGNLLFRNKTDPTYKTFFGEGEDFLTYLNLTYSTNGTSIENSQCNITLEEGIVENKFIDTNFSICNSAVTCDYDLLHTEEITLTTSNGDIAQEDSIHFNGCHNEQALSDITVNIQCGASSTDYTVTPPQIPLCDNGFGFVLINDTAKTCLTEDKVNVTVSVPVGTIYSKGKVIEGLSLDRKYNQHTNVWDIEVFYNATSELYYINGTHEYYIHDTYNVFSNCSNVNTDLYNSTSATLTIVNAPPQIFLQTMNNSLGTFPLTNNSKYEYADGNWSWVGSIVDDDLDTFNVIWYNSSNDIIFSFLDVPSLNITQLDTPSKLFQEFKNPYRLFVNATDTGGLTSEREITFTVNDTVSPVISVTSPSGLLQNTSKHSNNENFNFDITYTDESVYKTGFSLFLSNGTNIYNSDVTHNPTVTSYNLNDVIASLNITPSTYLYGSVNISDGHTLTDAYDRLKATINKGLENEIVSQDFKLIFNDELEKIDLDYTNDRVKQKIKFTNKLNYAVIDLVPLNDPEVNIIQSEEYFNYLIVNDFWIDFVSDDTENVIIEKVNGGEYYRITVYFNKLIDNVQFNSIGILNTVKKDFIIELKPEIELADTNMSNFDLTKQSNVFIMMCLVFCMLGCYFLGFTFKNFAFIGFGFFVGLIVGFMVFQISWFATAVFWLINASIFIGVSKNRKF